MTKINTDEKLENLKNLLCDINDNTDKINWWLDEKNNQQEILEEIREVNKILPDIKDSINSKFCESNLKELVEKIIDIDNHYQREYHQDYWNMLVQNNQNLQRIKNEINCISWLVFGFIMFTIIFSHH